MVQSMYTKQIMQRKYHAGYSLISSGCTSVVARVMDVSLKYKHKEPTPLYFYWKQLLRTSCGLSYPLTINADLSASTKIKIEMDMDMQIRSVS